MKLSESLKYIRFRYDNYQNDPRPKVKLLDATYPGIRGQSTFGKRRDLLGWNVNYFRNRRYARRAIDEIESFASLLSANKDEKYRRIKHFFPEQAQFIRIYNKQYIRSLKEKIGIRWRRVAFDGLTLESD